MLKGFTTQHRKLRFPTKLPKALRSHPASPGAATELTGRLPVFSRPNFTGELTSSLQPTLSVTGLDGQAQSII